jgi:hypothetical protein
MVLLYTVELESLRKGLRPFLHREKEPVNIGRKRGDVKKNERFPPYFAAPRQKNRGAELAAVVIRDLSRSSITRGCQGEFIDPGRAQLGKVLLA